MSDKTYSPRVVPRCPCCVSLAVPNVDVAHATEEQQDEQTSVTQTPLFSLGDLILDTRWNGNDRECGLLVEGSITGRFISVLRRNYKTMATRRHTHISNYMIRKCVGGVFVKKRNTHTHTKC